MLSSIHKHATLMAIYLSPLFINDYAQAAGELEEVVVTAQRRAQSTQDIPVAVTGLTSNQLEKFGFENANDISAQVPNMQVSGPYGDVQPIFSIRGVSMSDYSSNQASPIGVYVDEAYLAPVYSHGANFFDIERLEVLRGPQGTLYGKNTTGGAINIITRTPQIGDKLNGYLKLGAGSYGATSAEAAIEDTVIDDKLAARFAASFKKDEGYVENRLGSANLAQTDFQGARLALNYALSDAWTAVFKYTRSGNDALTTTSRNEPRIDIRDTGAPQDGTNGFIDNNGYSRPGRNLDFHETESNQVGPLITDTDLVGLTLTYNAETYSIISVSSFLDADYYQDANTDGSPEGLLEIVWSSDTVSYSQDFRFVSEFGGRFNLIAGLYYGFEDLDMHNVYEIYDTLPDARVVLANPDTAPLGPFLVDFGKVDQKLSTEKESSAIYAQMRFDFSERLGFDFGLRYTKDVNTLTHLNISRIGYDDSPRGTYVPGNQTGVDNAFNPPPLTATELQQILSDPTKLQQAQSTGYTHGPYNQDSAPKLEADEKEWTGKLGVDYKLSEDTMIYGSLSRGYRSGSFNGGVYYEVRPLATAYARPEFLDAYEIGIKSELLDNRVRLNAAIFKYEYTDQQFINVVGISNFLENAGGSEILGFEAELWASVTDKLVLQFALGYLDTEYTELTLANTQTIADANDTVDLSGNELISAPKYNLSFSFDYDLLVTDNGYLSVNGNANYQDDQWYSAYNDDIGYEFTSQEAYWLYNARISWHASNDAYTVSLWGKNLANKEYDSYAINLQSGFGYDYYLPGEPIRYGADFTYRF